MPSPTGDHVHVPSTGGGAKKKPGDTPPKPMGKKPFPGAAPPFGGKKEKGKPPAKKK